MDSLKSITNKIEGAEGLKALVETYKLIAATSMRRIRNFVLENRAFHLGLHGIYQEVKRSYATLIGVAKRRGRNKKLPALVKKNPKSAFVFISANTGLYGEIIYKTFRMFIDAIRKDKPDDAVVLGRVGEALFRQEMPEKRFTRFDFSDSKISTDEVRAITKHLAKFDKVIVFHGVFRNFLTQSAVASQISGEILPEKMDGGEVVRYIFEPTLEAVAFFFETEIFASLLEQSFNESRLAKLASRMMLLDRSGQNIDVFVERIFFQRQKIKHRALNIKQMDTVRGVIAAIQ